MTQEDDLYALFGLRSTCTDQELSTAFRGLIKANHPDLNPDRINEATRTTQNLLAAYDQICSSREGPQDAIETSTPFGIVYAEPEWIDLQDIRERREAFRQAWQRFTRSPQGITHALRLIHAAARVYRLPLVVNLLNNPVLADSAMLLLNLAAPESASDTLIAWSQHLYDNGETDRAIQMVEDLFASAPVRTPQLSAQLSHLHYAAAQYENPKTGAKAAPEQRLTHLLRFEQLRPGEGWTYKLLAGAYHAVGRDTEARESLREAYRLSPDLSGVKRLSEALGVTPPPTAPRGVCRFRRKSEVPSIEEACDWARQGDWDTLLYYSSPNDYEPSIQPAARDLLVQIASLLADCPLSQRNEALWAMTDFQRYGNVQHAAWKSLARCGDASTLAKLKNLKPDYHKPLLAHCIAYLQTRLEEASSDLHSADTKDIVGLARRVHAQRQYGVSRRLLETVIATLSMSHPDFGDVSLMMAECCAQMDDIPEALGWARPVRTLLRRSPARRQLAAQVCQWTLTQFWTDARSARPVDRDDDYIFALDTALELLTTAKTRNEFLAGVREVEGWLFATGDHHSIAWIRERMGHDLLLKWYAERPNRSQLPIPQAQVSEAVRREASRVAEIAKATVSSQLAVWLGNGPDIPQHRAK